MPPASRAVRARAVHNDNDENGASTRLTRAAAAKLSIDDISSVANVQKPLQTKKSASKVNQQPGRRRPALGDVSNVSKGEAVEVKGKKATGAKVGLVSKASQSAGISKQQRGASRTALAAKDKNKSTEVTRPASGSGVGGPIKRKQKVASANTIAVKEETPVVEKQEDNEDEEPARKKVHTDKAAKVEVKSIVQETVVEEQVETDDEELAHKDLDAEDCDDPLMCSEYVVEIFQYLNKLEIATAPNPNYMDHQDDLEWKMRGILVDWLIEVHTRFHLLPETLFLTVNIIDRFLSEKVVQLDRLQLVGVTAMFIASKYEEVLSPHVANFRHVADDGFTEEEILSAERYLLTALNYDLSYPNPMNFLRRISKADDYDIQTRTLGKYLMEISLLDHRLMEFVPSHVAAAAMYLSRMIMEKDEWDATLAHYSGYTEKEMVPVVEIMIDYLIQAPVHEAFFRKYASKKFMKASIITRAWAKKNAPAFGIELPGQSS